jgi:serine/threonine protein kinase
LLTKIIIAETPQWLDTVANHDHRPKVIRFIVDLAYQSKHLPLSLFIKGVHVSQADVIAFGGCADIYLGQYRGQTVAVKRLRIHGQQQTLQKVHTVGIFYFRRRALSAALILMQSLCKESLVWRQLSHPNILPFYGVDAETFKHHLALVSPWIPRGSLKEYISKSDCDLPLHFMIFVRFYITRMFIADPIYSSGRSRLLCSIFIIRGSLTAICTG